MSEEFDKEAEKEKLRQQLADEEEARKSTQHMSELLLKGATMTNRHCGNCGDPVFRHEGQEFCPSCGWTPGAPEQASEQSSASGGSTVDASSDGATADDGAAMTHSASSGGRAGSEGSESESVRASTTGEADLPAAREALARRVTGLAHEAERTRDIGRTRELLAAVREGAEALRAIDGLGR